MPAANTDRDLGFSLIELIIVVTIIIILAYAVVLPGVKRYVETAKIKEATAELQAMKSVIDTYFANYHQFPSGPDFKFPHIGDVLQEKGVNWNDSSPNGLRDPWGQSYAYRTTEWHVGWVQVNIPRQNHYIILSKGPDKLEENKDDIYVTESRGPSRDLTTESVPNPSPPPTEIKKYIWSDLYDFTFMGLPHGEFYESYSSNQHWRGPNL